MGGRAVDRTGLESSRRKGGRVVDCTGLENRRWATIRGFESHPFRQKVHGNHLAWYMLDQLPMAPPTAYLRMFGCKSAAAIVREPDLAQSFNDPDLAPFALAHRGHFSPAAPAPSPGHRHHHHTT